MNLPQLNNLINYVILMCFANFMCFIYQIPYHFKVFYISIIFYKLLPMFMIHVSFLNISLSLFTCFMPAYSKKVDMGKSYMYPRVLSLYEIVISICA